MPDNPFGKDAPSGPRRKNPFGDDDGPDATAAAVARLEQAAVKIRGLRTQLGAEGLSLPATRTLIDEVTSAFDAVARALRSGGGA